MEDTGMGYSLVTSFPRKVHRMRPTRASGPRVILSFFVLQNCAIRALTIPYGIIPTSRTFNTNQRSWGGGGLTDHGGLCWGQPLQGGVIDSMRPCLVGTQISEPDSRQKDKSENLIDGAKRCWHQFYHFTCILGLTVRPPYVYEPRIQDLTSLILPTD